MTDPTTTALDRLEKLADDRLDLHRAAPGLAEQDWGIPFNAYTRRDVPAEEMDAYMAYLRTAHAALLAPASSLAQDRNLAAALPDVRWHGSASEILTDLRRALPQDQRPRFDAVVGKLRQLSSSLLLAQLKLISIPEYVTHKATMDADAAEAELAAARRRLALAGGLALCLAALAGGLTWLAASGTVPLVTGYTR